MICSPTKMTVNFFQLSLRFRESFVDSFFGIDQAFSMLHDRKLGVDECDQALPFSPFPCLTCPPRSLSPTNYPRVRTCRKTHVNEELCRRRFTVHGLSIASKAKGDDGYGEGTMQPSPKQKELTVIVCVPPSIGNPS